MLYNAPTDDDSDHGDPRGQPDMDDEDAIARSNSIAKDRVYKPPEIKPKKPNTVWI